MKDNYSKSIQLRCITCGDIDFEFNEDKSWIKCNRCGKEYDGGYDELVELNKENINQELEKTKEEFGEDLQKEMTDIIKNKLKGNKILRIK